MKYSLHRPSELHTEIFQQLIKLIASGDQIERAGLETRLLNADLTALLIDGDNIVSTATLKNPATSYRNNVFDAAAVADQRERFSKELGYIVTNPNYEGKKCCQKLLEAFIPQINGENIFATTRKASMAHILAKHQFKQIGDVFKGDLWLLTFNAERNISC